MMRFYFTLISLFFIALFATNANDKNPSIIQNEIIIKFKADNEILNKWLESGRNCEFKEFLSLLGEHTSSGFIDSKTITGFRNKIIKNTLPSFTKSSNILNKINNIERICVIKYSSKVNARIAARKIASYPFVEYAEPMPTHFLSFIPNDPLIYNQYYLNLVKSYNAWDLIDTTKSIVIGIVDTGVDYTHPDLALNIYSNPGEIGLDSNGVDKRFNGKDDDNDGYIDDWRGWDFVSSDSVGQDNDPFPGHGHGTHCSGIASGVVNNSIGIAGVSKIGKILPVKVASDSPSNTSIQEGYNGILYASLAGAQVINCSWGGGEKSTAEQEIIDVAVSNGSVIAAAAGNNSTDGAFYPAAYNGVMSVAATNSGDQVAYFSNYHGTVDVSAPGVNILSTVPSYSYVTYDSVKTYDTTFDNNQQIIKIDTNLVKIDTVTHNVAYESWNGTSMATPVAVGVAAIVRSVFPNYTPAQIIEQVKCSSDYIDTLNSQIYWGKIGKGRVNAYNAITMTNLKSIVLNDYSITDSNGDGSYDSGETINISMSFLNILSNLTGVKIEFYPDTTYGFKAIDNTRYLNDMTINETKSIAPSFSFIVPSDLPYDQAVDFKVIISDTVGNINTETITITFNPSYRTLDANNISVTFNSRGNIAYNDYSTNAQGIGFKYKNSESLLFEGGLMTAISAMRIADCVRGYSTDYQDNSFVTSSVLKKIINGSIANQEAYTDYYTSSDISGLDLDIYQSAYQYSSSANKDFVIVGYHIKNTSQENYDSLYTGLYFDWDIGASGANNQTSWLDNETFGYTQCMSDSTLPLIGVKLLSGQAVNFYAIDNDGSDSSNMGVWDHFSLDEKWLMLSQGLSRKQSNVTDASMVIGAGPIKLNSGDSTTIYFSLFAGNTLDDLKKTALASAKFPNIVSVKENNIISNEYLKVYPNPVLNSDINIEFSIEKQSNISLEIDDPLGRSILKIIDNDSYSTGTYHKVINTSGFNTGIYMVKLIKDNVIISQKFVVL